MSSIRVVAAVFTRKLNGQTQWLIFRRGPDQSGAGSWEFPGGKVEIGETDEQALKREIFEELGMPIEVRAKIAENRHDYPKKSILLVAYSANFLPSEVPIQLTDHDEMLWVNASELKAADLAAADLPLVGPILSQS